MEREQAARLRPASKADWMPGRFHFHRAKDLKPRLLSLHEGEDCLNGEKRKC